MKCRHHHRLAALIWWSISWRCHHPLSSDHFQSVRHGNGPFCRVVDVVFALGSPNVGKVTIAMRLPAIGPIRWHRGRKHAGPDKVQPVHNSWPSTVRTCPARQPHSRDVKWHRIHNKGRTRTGLIVNAVVNPADAFDVAVPANVHGEEDSHDEGPMNEENACKFALRPSNSTNCFPGVRRQNSPHCHQRRRHRHPIALATVGSTRR